MKSIIIIAVFIIIAVVTVVIFNSEGIPVCLMVCEPWG